MRFWPNVITHILSYSCVLRFCLHFALQLNAHVRFQSSVCTFKKYTSAKPYIAHTEQLHYIHLPKRTSITAKCPSKSVKMTELQGTFILPTTCTLLSNEVHIFPHHIYLEHANVRLPSPEIFVIKSKVFDSPPGNVSTTSDLIKEKIHLERKFIKIQRCIL